MKRVSQSISSFIVAKKRENPSLSCRAIVLEAGEKFHVKVSKSIVNSILKEQHLSSPVGRRSTRNFRVEAKLEGAGFIFLLGASRLLGVHKILADILYRELPSGSCSHQQLQELSELCLMAKAYYNIPLEKVLDFRQKEELWLLSGRRFNKGLLARYLNWLKLLQPIHFKDVAEKLGQVFDVHYYRFFLKDGKTFCVDGQFFCLWRQETIPIDLFATSRATVGYIKSVLAGEVPLILLTAKSQLIESEEVMEFLKSFVDPTEGIERVEVVASGGKVMENLKPESVVSRRRFILGVWPGQHQSLEESINKRVAEKLVFGPLDESFLLADKEIKVTQLIGNKEVAVRSIMMQRASEKSLCGGLLTNIAPLEASAPEVGEMFLRKWPAFDQSRDYFESLEKKSSYMDDLLSSEKSLEEAKKMSTLQNVDELFSVFVNILSRYAQRVFFVRDCAQWGFFKMRELVWKKNGRIKRDLSQDIICKLLDINMLHEKQIISEATKKFNEILIKDFSGRKIWVLF